MARTRRLPGSRIALSVVSATLFAATAAAQTAGPSIVSREAADKVTVRTVRLERPLRVDGRLDDSVYATVEPISDFIQQEPHEGEPATEKTDAWIFFDDTSLYIAARCWDSHPEREVANELRRDNGNILGNENFTFVIDTLHDRRSGYLFHYITDAPGTTVLNREAGGLFRVDFETSDQLMFEYSREYELLPGRFPISPGVVVPAGGYDYQTSRVTYVLGQQRKLSGRVSAAGGTLYDGTKSELTYTGRIGVLPQFSVEPGVAIDWVQLPFGDFTERLFNSRFTVTPSARMLISSLVQYNAAARSVSSSIRLRWEYTGGSELFVVYSDGRNSTGPGFPALLNRTFAIKATRLVRF